MKKLSVPVSASFRRRTVSAILSIIAFVCTYILLLAIAAGLTALCCYLGVFIMATKPGFYTLLLGAGLVSMGLLLLVFLVKFLFKKYKSDHSHLRLITSDEAPGLFEMIGAVSAEVNTSFPKKIYLSADVNASVFYDSTFWSMIVPVKKNLTIGLGLVNSLTVSELKAVLAHEFGHFSQRSMKVGGYVYHVNQVIYNMLFENESYEAFAGSLARLHGAIALFVGIAVKIVNVIQWLLKKMYILININYMGLSREMEFHADKVAASVTGSMPLINALLRLQMADQCFQNVVNYYNNKITDCIKTENIYPQQKFVMTARGKESRLPFPHDFPEVSLEFLNRYNKSKLVIEDKWASHPGTAERIKELRQRDTGKCREDNRNSFALFEQPEKLQQELTGKLFACVEYSTPPVDQEVQHFFDDFTSEMRKSSFGKIFNNYYEFRNPVPDAFEVSGVDFDEEISLHDLFGDESVNLVYASVGLENDLETLKQLIDGVQKVKRVNYDGTVYVAGQYSGLIDMLQAKLQALEKRIAENDKNIYAYFLSLASYQGREREYKKMYSDFLEMAKAYDNRLAQYAILINDTRFIHETNKFEVIEQNLATLAEKEQVFKKDILVVLADDRFAEDITEEAKEVFKKYVAADLVYFVRPGYDDAALNILFTSLVHYQEVLSGNFSRIKKTFLDYKANLITGTQPIEIGAGSSSMLLSAG